MHSTLNPQRTPLAAQLARWDQLRAAMADPSVELTVEEFAPILATFYALRRAGHLMDPMLTVLISVLERQLHHTHEDSDSDWCITGERRLASRGRRAEGRDDSVSRCGARR